VHGEGVADKVLEEVEAEVKQLLAFVDAVAEVMAEEHPVVGQGVVEHLARVEGAVDQAVGPQRHAQQRNEQRRAVPSRDAVHEQAAVGRRVAHVGQQQPQVVLRQLNDVPVAILGPPRKRRRGG